MKNYLHKVIELLNDSNSNLPIELIDTLKIKKSKEFKYIIEGKFDYLDYPAYKYFTELEEDKSIPVTGICCHSRKNKIVVSMYVPDILTKYYTGFEDNLYTFKDSSTEFESWQYFQIDPKSIEIRLICKQLGVPRPLAVFSHYGDYYFVRSINHMALKHPNEDHQESSITCLRLK